MGTVNLEKKKKNRYTCTVAVNKCPACLGLYFQNTCGLTNEHIWQHVAVTIHSEYRNN